MLKLFEHVLHSQAQKNTSSTKYPFPSTIIPATCEITANPRFWIDCILKEQIKSKSTCKYFAVEKVIVCFASLLHMTSEKKASLNKIKTSEHLIEECARPSKCPGMEVWPNGAKFKKQNWTYFQTNLLSRSQEISIKLNKVNSRSTDSLSRSRHIESSSTK